MSIPGRRGFTQEEFEAAFWSKVEIKGMDDCWPWKGWRRKDGYGRFKRKGKSFLAHREAFMLEYGATLPSEVLVCHNCDNPPCCNPRHFFIGENDDNLKDAAAKGLCSRGEQRWNHKLTDSLVKQILTKHIPGIYGCRRLARDFNVSVKLIQHVLSRRIWKHITL